ncbi:MAG: response regulator [Planctomycetes bacterium]|nr:response regulator [Planctomycetota bacterium]
MPTRLLLLVEDNPDDEALTRRALRRIDDFDVEIVVARDGVDALALLCGTDPARTLPRRPDLVLLDLKMPRMSGLEALGAIRGHSDLAGLPVVVFTSSAEPRDRAGCLALGASGFVSKPVEYLAFAEAVAGIARRWLSASAPRAAREADG